MSSPDNITGDWWVSFNAMLTEKQQEYLGISEDRGATLCITRLAAAYGDLQSRLAATTAALEAVQAEAAHAATAYLGALGHAIPGDHDGKLSDGSEPQNVLARFLSREVEEEASRYRATTRELEAARLSIEDRERIITRHDGELKAARVQNAITLWECPECLFAFDASHQDTDGGYTCPVCAEARLEKEVATAILQSDSFARLLAENESRCVGIGWLETETAEGDQAVAYLIARGLAVRHESNKSWWRFVEASK